MAATQSTEPSQAAQCSAVPPVGPDELGTDGSNPSSSSSSTAGAFAAQASSVSARRSTGPSPSTIPGNFSTNDRAHPSAVRDDTPAAVVQPATRIAPSPATSRNAGNAPPPGAETGSGLTSTGRCGSCVGGCSPYSPWLVRRREHRRIRVDQRAHAVGEAKRRGEEDVRRRAALDEVPRDLCATLRAVSVVDHPLRLASSDDRCPSRRDPRRLRAAGRPLA